ALVCSEYEAFSRVALEAMSTALPVIGRNSGGTPEIIVDGETGLLYNTFDELVEAMRRLAQDRSLSRKMGLAGWERARELFSIEKYASSVYQVIQSVMSKA
ncbi:MAG: glycosyltransferase family 4 protein, partial [Chloroflexi bacterium]|nr:glycosyltransferase family 4 protein [Chloroflexota bacterium]